VLREAAGPEYDQLITDQWDRTVWWKYGFDGDGPRLTETADGKWAVTFTVKTDKDIKTEEMETAESWADIDGEVLNEPLEIGFYTDEPKNLWSAAPPGAAISFRDPARCALPSRLCAVMARASFRTSMI